MNDDIRSRRTVKLYTLNDLLREIRATYSGKSETTELAFVEKLSKLSLLILDECTEKSGSDFEFRTLNAIVDRRYGAMLPLVIISNERREAFADSIGFSAASRMQESGCIIECTWPSFRTSIPEPIQKIREEHALTEWARDLSRLRTVC